MGLFVAILLSETNKDALEHITAHIRPNVRQASFSRRENLHLTLNFLGEVEKPNEAIAAMNCVKAMPFEFRIVRTGSFKNGDEHTVWAGTERCPALSDVFEQLSEALTSAGFKLESRSFSPHITLARRALPCEGFSFSGISFAPIKVQVDKISLMKSERIGGQLKYTEIFFKPLINNVLQDI